MEYNQKQKQIIATAEKLFSKKGYEGTSVRDISDEAGVNIAMISYYFGSKEKLMEALFEQRSNHIKLTVESLLQNAELAPLEKLQLIVEDYIDKTLDKQDFFKIMIGEQVFNKNPAILTLIHELKKKNIEEIGKLVKEGQKNGDFRKDIDVFLVVNTLVGTITQMVIGSEFYRDINNLNTLGPDEFLALIKQKLSDHIKVLFKALLSNEA